MKVKLRRVGNSVGLTIPASELRALGARNGDLVEVELKRVIRSVREGWSDLKQWHGVENEALLLDEEPGNNFDREDWQW